MKKPQSSTFKSLAPEDYPRDFSRIDSQINELSDEDLNSLLTSDVPFRAFYKQHITSDFDALLASDSELKRQSYKIFLHSVFQFPQSTYQSN